jgi:hypothetical protein
MTTKKKNKNKRKVIEGMMAVRENTLSLAATEGRKEKHKGENRLKQPAACITLR